MNQMGNGAIQAASGTGGLGNRQTATALASQRVVYKDIFVHNLHVTIQEFQKKQKMHQKRVVLKRKFEESVYPPEIQYMNIYKQTARRLSVFTDIDSQFDEECP